MNSEPGRLGCTLASFCRSGFAACATAALVWLPSCFVYPSVAVQGVPADAPGAIPRAVESTWGARTGPQHMPAHSPVVLPSGVQPSSSSGCPLLVDTKLFGDPLNSPLSDVACCRSTANVRGAAAGALSHKPQSPDSKTISRPPPPPRGGTVTLAQKAQEILGGKEIFYKAPKLIYTVILWYRFVVRPPTPPKGGTVTL